MSGGVSLAWAVYPDASAHDTLDQWATRLKNPKPAFNEMADVIAASQKQWFATKGEGTWAPLKEPYRTWKKKRFPKRGILHGPDRPGHRGLQLRDQLTKRPFGVERITEKELVIGTDLDYAAFHAKGTRNMPKRPPMKPMDAQTQAALTHIMQVHVVGETMGR